MNEKTDICEGFLAQVVELGIPKEAGEGMLTELGLLETSQLSKEAKEKEFLALWGGKYASISDLQHALIEESRGFRDGLKAAMLSEGVEETVVDGIFKEAEVQFTEIMQGGLAKEAGIGSALKSFGKGTAKLFSTGGKLEANALRRGFTSTDDYLKSLAPGISQADTGLEALGKLPDLNAGATRIYLGDKLTDIGMPGFGRWMGDKGKNALRTQATDLADKAYATQANDLIRKVQTEAESASGVAAATRQALGKMKTRQIPNTQAVGAAKQDTIQQGIDAAEQAIKDPLGVKSIKSQSASRNWVGGGNGHVRFNPAKGGKRALIGAGLGTLIGGPVGGIIGGVGGGLTGTLGTGGTLLAGATAYGANKYLNPGPKPGSYEAGADRNRVLPFMSNQWTGGLGGALLGSILANELGLEGVPAWLLPLLGGVAGYNYLPDMVNNFKDPLGYGNNAVPMSHQAGNLRTFGYTPQQ